MSDVAKTLVGLVPMIAITGLTGWPLFAGLRRGVIYSQRVAYSRSDDPSSFWFYVTGYSIAFVSSAGLLIYIGGDILLHL